MLAFVVALASVWLLTACQQQWQLHSQEGVVQAEFPNDVQVTQREQKLPNGKLIHFTHWSSQLDASTFNLAFSSQDEQNPEQTLADAKALIQTMHSQWDGNSNTTLPEVNEQFVLWSQVTGRAFMIKAAVLYKNNHIVQAYVAGPASAQLSEQAQQFLDSVRMD